MKWKKEGNKWSLDDGKLIIELVKNKYELFYPGQQEYQLYETYNNLEEAQKEGRKLLESYK